MMFAWYFSSLQVGVRRKAAQVICPGVRPGRAVAIIRGLIATSEVDDFCVPTFPWTTSLLFSHRSAQLPDAQPCLQEGGCFVLVFLDFTP